MSLGSLLLGPAFARSLPSNVGTHDLETRAKARDWAETVEYGRKIVSMTQAKTDAAAEKIFGSSLVSKFTTTADLEKYGWVEDKNFDFTFFKLPLKMKCTRL